MAHLCHSPSQSIATNFGCAIISPVRGRRTLPISVARDGKCVKDDVAEAVLLGCFFEPFIHYDRRQVDVIEIDDVIGAPLGARD